MHINTDVYIWFSKEWEREHPTKSYILVQQWTNIYTLSQQFTDCFNCVYLVAYSTCILTNKQQQQQLSLAYMHICDITQETTSSKWNLKGILIFFLKFFQRFSFERFREGGRGTFAENTSDSRVNWDLRFMKVTE